MTQTLEHMPVPTVERTATPMTLDEIVDRALSRVEEMDEGEKERQLENLILCGKRVELLNYIKRGQIDQVVKDIPSIAALCQKIHDTAESLLQEVALDADSRTVIVDLGTASDMVGDATILERTLGAITDKTEVHVEPIVRALTVAHNDGRLFSDVYSRVKVGKTVYENANVPVVMSQLPDFPKDHPYAYLSQPITVGDNPYRPRHNTDVLVDEEGRPVTTEQAIHGIQKNPKTGSFGDRYTD